MVNIKLALIAGFSFVAFALSIAGIASPVDSVSQTVDSFSIYVYSSLWDSCRKLTPPNDQLPNGCTSIDVSLLSSQTCSGLADRWYAARTFAVMSVVACFAAFFITLGRLCAPKLGEIFHGNIALFTLSFAAFATFVATFIIMSIKTSPPCGGENDPNVSIGPSCFCFLAACIICCGCALSEFLDYRNRIGQVFGTYASVF